MPLVAAVPEYRIERSTSFSHQRDNSENEEWKDAQGFGLDVVDLYQLIKEGGGGGTPTGDASNHNQKLDDVVSDFYRQYVQKQREAQEDARQGKKDDDTAAAASSSRSEWTPSEQVEHQRLLRQTLEYVQVPVLLHDAEDDSLVGAWPHTVSEWLEQSPVDPASKNSKIRLVPPTTLTWVVQDLAEWEQSREAIPAESSSRATTTTTSSSA